MRRLMVILPLVALWALGNGAHAGVPFNNPDYVYTQVDDENYAIWPDYSSAAGKVLWRDGASTENGRTGYLADFDPATGAVTNKTTFGATDQEVYDASFSPSGDYVFYQDISTTTSLTVDGETVEAYPVRRYELSSGTIETVFDISTVDSSEVESLTDYRGSEFGFYISQGGSDQDLLMSVRDGNGQMDVVKYSITNETFTNLTNSSQAEYDGQYLGTDSSKLIYWSESAPNHDVRSIAILSGGTETVLDSVDIADPDPDMYLAARWGADHSHAFATLGTGFGNTDLMLFKKNGSWGSPIDVTGSGWSYADGAISIGAATGQGFIFGVRDANNPANTGLWYATPAPIPEPAGLGLLGLTLLGVRRRKRS